MGDSPPWQRQEDRENGDYIRFWKRGEQTLAIRDVSDEAYYKVNYLCEVNNEPQTGFVSLCDAAGHVAEEHRIVPVDSVWRYTKGNLYAVKHPNPPSDPEEFDVNVKSFDIQRVYCLAPNIFDGRDYVFIPRTMFFNGGLEIIDWNP